MSAISVAERVALCVEANEEVLNAARRWENEKAAIKLASAAGHKLVETADQGIQTDPYDLHADVKHKCLLWMESIQYCYVRSWTEDAFANSSSTCAIVLEWKYSMHHPEASFVSIPMSWSEFAYPENADCVPSRKRRLHIVSKSDYCTPSTKCSQMIELPYLSQSHCMSPVSGKRHIHVKLIHRLRSVNRKLSFSDCGDSPLSPCAIKEDGGPEISEQLGDCEFASKDIVPARRQLAQHPSAAASMDEHYERVISKLGLPIRI